MGLLDRFNISLPPMPKAPPQHTLHRATLLYLSFIVLIAVIAHFLLGHWFIASYGLMVWGIKSASVLGTRRAPPKLLTLVLTLLSFVFILAFYGGWNGQRAGISFLVLLASLKFLESETLRDYFLVCLLLLFLASTSFLFESSLLNIILVIAYTISIVAIMLEIANPSKGSRFGRFKTASTIMLKALPLAIILFVFFPRIQGNFGFIPSQDELDGSSQLRDSMVSGEFASAAFNNTTAFEVSFDGEIPSNQRLYWRSKVMTEEVDFQWAIKKLTAQELSAARSNKVKLATPVDSNQAQSTATTQYEIVHQSSSDDYLPYLDYALSPGLGVQLQDYSVYRGDKVDGVFAYRGIASAYPHLDDQSIQSRSELLTTQSVPSSRVIDLIKQWRSTATTDQQLVQAVYQYYLDQPFNYSLLPPSLGENKMDEFLFETQTGYCEHYASSFTTLIRWLGIPARVVVGYQGGKRNNVGNYLEVKYSDAHAWSEVWFNNRWNRIDPTAAISPERIEYGMEALISQWDGVDFDFGNQSLALSNYLNPTGWQKTINQLSDGWDNIGFQWDKWVVNYNFDTQKNLLASIGLKHGRSLYTLLGFLMLGTLGLMAIYFWQLIPKAVKLVEPQLSYMKFASKFAKQKIYKRNSESPLEFAVRLNVEYPDQADQIDAITQRYVNLRFGRDSGSVAEFKQLVKQFKVIEHKG